MSKLSVLIDQTEDSHQPCRRWNNISPPEILKKNVTNWNFEELLYDKLYQGTYAKAKFSLKLDEKTELQPHLLLFTDPENMDICFISWACFTTPRPRSPRADSYRDIW